MDQQHPEVPAYQPPAGQPTPTVTPGDTKRRTIALWLLIGPTALIIGSIILYALVNLIMSNAGQSDMSNTAASAINIILFVIGVISTTTWLPGLIIGIVLLATQKKV